MRNWSRWTRPTPPTGAAWRSRINGCRSLARDAGQREEAETGYRRCLAGYEELVALDPTNPTYRRDVGIALTALADMEFAAGRADDAATKYRRALAIDEWLLETDPHSETYQSDLRSIVRGWHSWRKSLTRNRRE